MDCFDLLHKQCAKNPHKIALTQYDGQQGISEVSYSDLLKQHAILKTAFTHLALKAGDSVLIQYPHSPQALILILSCLSFGLLTVPINQNTSTSRLKEFVGNLKPSLILTEQAQNILSPKGSLKKTSYEELIKIGGQAVPHNLFKQQNKKAILLMHTSGSSGTAKKILYNTAQLNQFMAYHDYLYRQFSDKDNEQVYTSDLISTLSFSHFGGLCLCLQGLMMGRTVHLLRNYSAKEYWSLVVKEKVSLLMMVPSMYEQLIDSINDFKEHELRFCMAMGEASTELLALKIKEKLNTRLFSTYGLSECQTGIGHEQGLIDSNSIPQGSCGRHLFGEIRLMNDDNEYSNEGELWVRNESTFSCYSDHELNHQVLYKGWFKTGDILRRDKQGNFFHLGRLDNLLIVNGKNIYPVEVEAIFLQHPKIENAVLVPLLRATGRIFLGVLLVLNKEKSLSKVSKEQLIDFYLENGNVHTTPGWLSFTKDLPLNNTGKLNRSVCAEILQAEYEHACCRVAS